MRHAETSLALYRVHAAEFQAEAAAYRLATAARRSRTRHALRVRLGWTLVEAGLRLAAAPKPAAVAP